jgi:hypothetical protein
LWGVTSHYFWPVPCFINFACSNFCSHYLGQHFVPRWIHFWYHLYGVEGLCPPCTPSNLGRSSKCQFVSRQSFKPRTLARTRRLISWSTPLLKGP